MKGNMGDWGDDEDDDVDLVELAMTFRTGLSTSWQDGVSEETRQALTETFMSMIRLVKVATGKDVVIFQLCDDLPEGCMAITTKLDRLLMSCEVYDHIMDQPDRCGLVLPEEMN